MVLSEEHMNQRRGRRCAKVIFRVMDTFQFGAFVLQVQNVHVHVDLRQCFA
jgi:hypothetical protein